MSRTFGTSPNGNLLVASKLWSDFAATIPLTRSFTYGENFPPEYPIFAGEPIKYHFGFFMLVGALERMGFPLSFALNFLSAISFTLLLIAIYHIGKVIFKNKTVGLLSIFIFLFNSSLGYISFFVKYPISINSLNNIVLNKNFTAFGPYDGNIISAFWSLNIYTNQRHLALAYSFFLFILLYLYKKHEHPKSFSIKSAIALGFLIGIFPFVHMAVFLMIAILLLVSLIIFPHIRSRVILTGSIAFIISIPQFLYMGNSPSSGNLFNPGYLIERLTLHSFFEYWFLNLGFFLVFFPLGIWFASKNQRKIFLPFIVLFILGFTLRFSPEAAANHKFFNLFVIGGNFFVALALVVLWKRNVLGKIFVPFFILVLTLSGIIDLFPIINDYNIELEDGLNNSTQQYILKNTPPNSVFLNSTYMYHPASLAGRRILMGWPYFPWSAGYNTDKRGKIMDKMFVSENKEQTCAMLLENRIDYITTIDGKQDFEVNIKLFEENFTKVFEDPRSTYSIYDVKKSCH